MEIKTIITFYRIIVKGGNGGHGQISFKRDRCVHWGKPDGGNGGNGGSVIFRCKKDTVYFTLFHLDRRFYGADGKKGKGQNKNGKNASDIYVNVPVGIKFYDEQDNFLGELLEDGDEYIIAPGGKGGIGNGYESYGGIEESMMNKTLGSIGIKRVLNIRLGIGETSDVYWEKKRRLIMESNEAANG